MPDDDTRHLTFRYTEHERLENNRLRAEWDVKHYLVLLTREAYESNTWSRRTTRAWNFDRGFPLLVDWTKMKESPTEEEVTESVKIF